jgi:serine/threonine-protein kinase
VFLARQIKSAQPVAIKVLHPEFAATLIAHRFHREIMILGGLHHPNILPLLESEEAGALLYYVMPYAKEASLRERLDKVPWLPIGDAIRVTKDVATALDYAHARNVLHRDIKPENIMFDDGQAKVCDFGVARAIVKAGGERLSSSGLVLGTPAYMSPEQASGEGHLDGRADVYSLACVVHEMLIGEPPFTGRTAQAIMARHVRQPPPSLRVVRSEISEQMERAIHRALAKQPEERPQTGGQFVAELAE